MSESKLKGWLEANKLNPERPLLLHLLFSHLGRALILVYYCSHNSNRIISFFARKFLRTHYHIEMSCRSIGYYFMMPHPRNIIIGAESIGDYVQINQNVTIGGNMQKIVTRGGVIHKLPIIKN